METKTVGWALCVIGALCAMVALGPVADMVGELTIIPVLGALAVICAGVSLVLNGERPRPYDQERDIWGQPS